MIALYCRCDYNVTVRLLILLMEELLNVLPILLLHFFETLLEILYHRLELRCRDGPHLRYDPVLGFLKCCWCSPVHLVLKVSPEEVIAWIEIRAVWWPIKSTTEATLVSQCEYLSMEVLVKHIEDRLCPVRHCTILHVPEAFHGIHALCDRYELGLEHVLIPFTIDCVVKEERPNNALRAHRTEHRDSDTLS